TAPPPAQRKTEKYGRIDGQQTRAAKTPHRPQPKNNRPPAADLAAEPCPRQPAQNRHPEQYEPGGPPVGCTPLHTMQYTTVIRKCKHEHSIPTNHQLPTAASPRQSIATKVALPLLVSL